MLRAPIYSIFLDLCESEKRAYFPIHYFFKCVFYIFHGIFEDFSSSNVKFYHHITVVMCIVCKEFQ